MGAALGLARRHLGQTWPNPSVGCVIVAADGSVIGRAVTAIGGRPHAEVLALAMAAGATRDATAYVTLEPCAHHGVTPPCADALIAAGVAGVVIGMRDPDARTDGRGAAKLRAAGIAVQEADAAGAAEVNAGFVCARTRGRPLVTLKMAATLDGRIATARGESQWITGAEARRASQGLRATHDAILVGVNTVLADDPLLTCRLPGARERPLVRVVADSRLRMPMTGRLAATTGAAPLWILARGDADAHRKLAFAALGAEVIDVAPAEAGIDLADALRALAGRGITRLLVEGGAQVAASLLRADLVDGIAWFAAPALMGADGFAAAARFGVERLDAMPRFDTVRVSRMGADTLTEMRRKEA